MNHIKRLFFGFFLFSFTVTAVFSQYSGRVLPGYTETAAVREVLFDSWLSAEIAPLMSLNADEVTDRYGRLFQVQQSRDSGTGLLAVSIQAAPSTDVQGRWVLYRRFTDGLPQEIRIYPLNDPTVWVSLSSASSRPEAGKSRLTLMIRGAPAVDGVSVGIPLVRLYTLPLSDIMNMTRSIVPWNLLYANPEDFESVRSTVAAIRQRLPSLVYLEDGAFNHEGRPVYIHTGLPQDPAEVLLALGSGQRPDQIAGGVNCSGFAKWIVDGIVYPEAGSRLFLEPLKQMTDSPQTHFTEPHRETRDVFFALDWTRHLASAVLSLSGRGTVLPADSGADITAEPFPRRTVHVPSVGYRSGALEPLLYWLAVTEPGHFYLAAISRDRGDPPLRQYHHIAALFPYFTEEGNFAVAVFESAVETTLSLFASRNEDAYIHLVRVRVPEKGRFNP